MAQHLLRLARLSRLQKSSTWNNGRSHRMSSAAKGKSRLGRGLSSLISVSELPVEGEVPVEPPAQVGAPDLPPLVVAPMAPASSLTPAEIRTDSILPNPHQPRKQFDEAGIQSLAASLKSTGLVQPIIVRPSP